MYDLIENIINHAYISGHSEQQYIYYTCCALILIFTVTFIDLFYRIVRGICKKGDF